jgi:hypothetical protein
VLSDEWLALIAVGLEAGLAESALILLHVEVRLRVVATLGVERRRWVLHTVLGGLWVDALLLVVGWPHLVFGLLI